MIYITETTPWNILPDCTSKEAIKKALAQYKNENTDSWFVKNRVFPALRWFCDREQIQKPAWLLVSPEPKEGEQPVFEFKPYFKDPLFYSKVAYNLLNFTVVTPQNIRELRVYFAGLIKDFRHADI